MKTIETDKHNIYTGSDSIAELNPFLSSGNYSAVFVLVDGKTRKHCLPKVKKEVPLLQKANVISIKGGERNKNINSALKIWNALSKQNADRRSLLINLGGGVITDIGGFTASTYKRGIDFINIPTTLLAQVDASVGGKTGIDLSNFKNQIGVFAFPKAVFIISSLLKTLDKRQLLSGFAEVIKHGLVADKDYWKSIISLNVNQTDFQNLSGLDMLIEHSIKIKNEIVSNDPHEKGLRKVLNFGHTIGHAIESASLGSKKPLLHGEAIAIGMICESYLSRKYCGLSSQELDEIIPSILNIFKPKPAKYPVKTLLALMKQDKKNRGSDINFTLLSAIGKAEINNSCTAELIEESIKFFNSLCE